MTRTVATLEVTERTFQEIADKLRAGGYEHLFMTDGTIDMYGIAIAAAPQPLGPVCTCLTNQLGPHYCEVHAA
ncbi:hypothetical protein BX589_101274 [Paraburkholderia fungorum]|jgi:hypothetical protein|uniref:hypothetical protein n=1 Tax=Paraburkholderia fungorum TaxID=134537 RepID=UPI000D07A368|nr:hypothetical protein [Paraburkholderia fungorum]PRZ56624.1 hypothetical protein BX589_101274 [Paraburkholderia fungorum]